MATGTVKWFSSKRGYGFIEMDGKDYFVHQDAILGIGYNKSLDEGECVKFDICRGPKGAQAQDVIRQ